MATGNTSNSSIKYAYTRLDSMSAGFSLFTGLTFYSDTNMTLPITLSYDRMVNAGVYGGNDSMKKTIIGINNTSLAVSTAEGHSGMTVRISYI